MRFLAVIEDAPVIERILGQIGEWGPSPPSRAPPAEQEWPRAARSRLATTGSLISPEPLFDPRRGVLWPLGGNSA